MFLKRLFLLFLMSSISYELSFLSKETSCLTTLKQAKEIADSLQSIFWSKDLGYYKDGETWTDANAFEDLTNLMLYLQIDDYDYINCDSHLAKLGAANEGKWDEFFQGSFDDAQWVLMLFFKIADYMDLHGKDSRNFSKSAADIYDYVSNQWDSTCGGGLWWSNAHDYKNAITNQLYLLTSAFGYLRNGNETYLENAKKTWEWLKFSGMRNEQGLWNDGLVIKTCKNNGQTTWIYNQAVIASGLGYLGSILNDSTLFDEAEISLDAAIKHLTINGILKESCDNATSPIGQCDHNQQLFKGLFTKHMTYYLETTNNEKRVSKYKDFLGVQKSAVWNLAKNNQSLVGNVWYDKNQGGSIFQPETTTAGIEALLSATKYGPCEEI